MNRAYFAKVFGLLCIMVVIFSSCGGTPPAPSTGKIEGRLLFDIPANAKSPMSGVIVELHSVEKTKGLDQKSTLAMQATADNQGHYSFQQLETNKGWLILVMWPSSGRPKNPCPKEYVGSNIHAFELGKDILSQNFTISVPNSSISDLGNTELDLSGVKNSWRSWYREVLSPYGSL